MAGQSTTSSLDLQHKIQSPMMGQRSYDKNAESTARAGKRLSYPLAIVKNADEEYCSTSTENDSEVEKGSDRHSEQLLLWKSAHDGRQTKRLPPKRKKFSKERER